MKNLFFVSVAIGFFSGATLSVKAQPSVNIEQVNNTGITNKSVKFIEGIEIRSAKTPAETPVKPNTVKEVPATEKTSDKADVSAIESFTSLQFKYAMMLDVDVETITNVTLFDEIDKWWATSYKFGGATEKGIDCSAYTCTLLHDAFGIIIPRTAREQYDNCIKINKTDLQLGDLVFFNTRRGRGKGITHVGLYLGNGYFTHASTSSGVTISNLTEPYWSSKYIRGGRIVSNSQTEQGEE